MANRYIITHYSNETEETPTVYKRLNELKDAEAAFLKIAEKKCRSTILYNTMTDEVLKIAIQGEPIYLVQAIELARKYLSENAVISFAMKASAKAAAGIVIGNIVTALSGVSVPGVGGVIVGHFLGPYYAIKGDAAAAAGAGAGVWGGLSGAVIGTLVGGPIGGVVGGIIGGTAVGAGTGALVKSLTHPNKCDNCKGTGLVDDYRLSGMLWVWIQEMKHSSSIIKEIEEINGT